MGSPGIGKRPLITKRRFLPNKTGNPAAQSLIVPKKIGATYRLDLHIPEEIFYRRFASKILGKQGEIHKKIMHDCGCRISIKGLPPTNSAISENVSVDCEITSDASINVTRGAQQLLMKINDLLKEKNLPASQLSDLVSRRP